MRLTERLARLERQTAVDQHFTIEQAARIAEVMATAALMARSPDTLDEAERLAMARAALPPGLGDPGRVVAEWLATHRLRRQL